MDSALTEDGVLAAADGRRAIGDESTRRRVLGSLVEHPLLDAWLAFPEEGRVTVRTGKVELGQGIRTALAIIAAEELVVSPARIDVARTTTGSTPDEGFTAGSRSIEQSGAAVRQACAHAYRLLRDRAAARLEVSADALVADDGVFTTSNGDTVSYFELAAEGPFDYLVTAPAPLQPAAEHRFIGRGIPRLDLPAKISGEPAYVPDLRLPGMRFARVLRPPRPGATLETATPATVGSADVVRDGNFVAVVAGSEGEAEEAAERLAALLDWRGGMGFPLDAADPSYMAAHVVSSYPIIDGLASDGPAPPDPISHDDAALVLHSRFTKPFLLHGSIGPSAAVALHDGASLTVWSHSQGVGFLGKSLADVLGLDRGAVTVHHLDGAGCYGHNGADDAALDAALVARACQGQPISLRWARADEHRFEPLGPAMVVDLTASLGRDGRVSSWDEDILTYRHNARPLPQATGSRLLASWSLDPPVERSRAAPMLDFEAGGHRNGTPHYELGAMRVVKRDVDDASPLRTSAMRSLGALANVFAIESFMDELASAAGADPVAFRLGHTSDPRARAVIEAAVELAGGLEVPAGDDSVGRGLGFAQYENSMAYVAVVVELEVPARTAQITLRHAWIAADAGEIIDPDGLLNQIEGGFVQAASWTIKEKVELGPDGPSCSDWDSYPILRFSEIPSIHTKLIDRPDCPPVGAGEASCGPAAGAIANALAQATGVRVRDLPFRPEAIRAAFDALD